MKAWATSRWDGSSSSLSPAPCTRLRARLASCRVATADRPTMAPMSSNEKREQIVQHEGDAFGRAQRVEHDHHGGAHGVGEQDLALRIGRLGRRRRALGRSAGAAFSRVFRARSMSRHTCVMTVVSQPPRLSTAPVSARDEPQPRLLHGVLGFARRAQHAVGDRPQAGPVLLESRAQGCVGHVRLLSFVMGMTDEGRAL